MTLILGIRCKDGLVMASDSMALESGPGSVGAIARHEVDKLVAYKELLWGCAGDVGMKQIIHDALAQCYGGVYDKSRSPSQFRVSFIEKIFPYIRKQYEAVVATVKSSGIQGQAPLANLLFAAHMQGGFHLISIEQDGNGCVIEPCHCCIGSGMKSGQALMRRLRIKEDLDVKTAEIVAYRTMDDAIHAEPSGIGPPIKMARYTLCEGKPKIEMLTTNEKNVIQSAVKAWTSTEEEALTKLMTEPSPTAEPIPAAPAADA